MLKWQISKWFVRIVEKNFYSLKANKLSTRKRDSIMNPRGVLTAERQKSSRTTTTEDSEDNLIS